MTAEWITVPFKGDFRIIDPPPSTIVWIVWMLEDAETHPRWQRWCSVYATEESARDYARHLQDMDPDAVYGVEGEYLIGAS